MLWDSKAQVRCGHLILNLQNQELNKLPSSINNSSCGVLFQQQKTAQDSRIASLCALSSFSQVVTL